ncbi:MAG TPA: alpha/beta hydrolase [Candidatus Thermoplasmatota archaeon]|nr:alpha/beta hydrolase [Candidatus Thermoplasmatota archaeon]
MPAVPLKGIRVHYETRGEGPALVMLHGALASHRAWIGQVPVFARSRRVVTPDLRGHGKTTRFGVAGNPWERWNVGLFTDDLLAFVDRVSRDDPVELVGASLGGIVAAWAAARRPDRVKSLVLVSTPPGPQERFERWFSRHTPDTLPEPDRRLMALWHGEPYWKDLARHGLAYFAKSRPEVFAPAEDLAAYKGPALVLQGRHDDLLEPGSLDEWQRLLPQAKTETVDGDHAFFADGRAGTRAMNQLLGAFLA